jgi:transposase
MELKRYIGIDVGKDKLHAACEVEKSAGKVKIKKRIFPNNTKGFEDLRTWANKNLKEEQKGHFIMEATGNYHEALATYLFDKGEKVYVENPARVNAFGKSTGVRTKTDEKDSVILIQFGKAFDLTPWAPPPLEYRMLLQYHRAIEMRNKERTAIINRINALLILPETPQVLLEEEKSLLLRIEESIEKMKEEIRKHLKSNPELDKEVKLVESIDGIGWLTAVLLVGTMAGGNRFKSAKEAASYLGLSVRECKSGKSIRGKSRLSKEGPAEVRKALYWPAVTACRYNPDVEALYTRLLERGKAKMLAIGAAMRKLVHITFGVLKHKKEYEPQVSII